MAVIGPPLGLASWAIEYTDVINCTVAGINCFVTLRVSFSIYRTDHHGIKNSRAGGNWHAQLHEKYYYGLSM